MFRPGIGTMTQLKAHLSLKEQAESWFCNLCVLFSVPFTIRAKNWIDLRRKGSYAVLIIPNGLRLLCPVLKKNGPSTYVGIQGYHKPSPED